MNAKINNFIQYNLLKILKALNNQPFIRFSGFYWPLVVKNWKYLYKEIFIAESYKFQSENPEPQIIDCGSNVGFSLLYFKKLYPRSHVTCIEANPFVFDALSLTVTKNQFADVSLLNLALVGDDRDNVLFYLETDLTSLGSSIIKRKNLTAERTVKAKKLSDIINKKIDFLKIDIEGAEYEVIAELERSGKLELIREAVIEIHKIDGLSADKLIEILKNNFTYTPISESEDCVLVRLTNVS